VDVDTGEVVEVDVEEEEDAEESSLGYE